MKKLEKLNFEKIKIEKSAMSTIKGGTSTTVMTEWGRGENEYPDDGTGNPDMVNYDPILVPFPKPKE